MWKKVAALALCAFMIFVAVIGSAALRPAPQPSAPISAIPLQQPAQNASSSDPAAPTTFVIQPGASTATFTVDEILRGSPNTVVGTGDQVSGQIAVDPTAPGSAQVGTILVNARSLATDDSSRNRMVANFILSTGDYEYISFQPTAITGLPDTATLGTPYTFQIDGQLTIKDVAKPATFTATVTPISPTELRGSASTTISYADWGIGIPQVPSVAGVDDNVQLQLDFVATESA